MYIHFKLCKFSNCFSIWMTTTKSCIYRDENWIANFSCIFENFTWLRWCRCLVKRKNRLVVRTDCKSPVDQSQPRQAETACWSDGLSRCSLVPYSLSFSSVICLFLFHAFGIQQLSSILFPSSSIFSSLPSNKKHF